MEAGDKRPVEVTDEQFTFRDNIVRRVLSNDYLVEQAGDVSARVVIDEMLDWCMGSINLQGRSQYKIESCFTEHAFAGPLFTGFIVHFGFECASDAVAFKMRWL